MGKKPYTPEQIIGKLREAEVVLAQGETAAQVCRSLTQRGIRKLGSGRSPG
jgi:putative transposase